MTTSRRVRKPVVKKNVIRSPLRTRISADINVPPTNNSTTSEEGSQSQQMPMRKSPIRSPLRRPVKRVNAVANLETEMSSDVAIELPSSESAPAAPAAPAPPNVVENGLRKFGFTTKKATFEEQEAVVMRVDIGMSTNGVKLTALKEMAQCEKSNLARNRIVPKNSGKERKEKEELTDKEKKDLRKLILKRVNEDTQEVLIATQSGMVLWCIACRCPVDHNRGHLNEHISTKKHKDALKSNSKELTESSKQREFIKEYFREGRNN